MSGLTIYRASAGSGKTYTLARDFISLVITEPELYKHILAVTFTNKATDEMKNRILEELHKLSLGDGSPMMEFIASDNKLTESEVSGRAKLILESILHNYSRFHIETIDRFFQKAIRAFTREIGLSGGYQIELDSERILSEAIDEMLMDLDDDPELLKWFVEFAREKVQEGKNWNLKRDLLILGKELNKEGFQVGSGELIKQLEDKKEFSAFQQELMQIKYRFENSLKEYAKKAMGIMVSEGLDTGSFKGQWGVAYFFKRLLEENFAPPTATILNALDEPTQWYTKTSDDIDRITAAYQNGMNDLLKSCIRLYEKDYKNYRSAEGVRNFLYTLGILTDISRRMRRVAESQGIFLLSDASRFLYGIIGDNDAPFVYEKIGNYFHHFMIDEFQDTSGLQWKNFKPLIENSLAYDRKCLVVGDVKQSIYRWRNSDWEILSEHVQKQFNPEQLDMQGLKYNWRSLENIIGFNNLFFKQAREIFHAHFNDDAEEDSLHAAKVNRAYTDVDQEVPEAVDRQGGHIRVSLIPDPEEGTWKDIADIQVIKHIEDLQDAGVGPSETVILVRSKRDGKRIADAILEYKSSRPDSKYLYDVISNESLYLYNSTSVRILVNALRFLVSPHDRVNLACLVFDYNVFTGKISAEDGSLDELMNGFRKGEAASLPEKFLDESLRYLTLTELTERIIALFSLDKQEEQTPYILGFQDIVLDYCRGGGADVNSFLNWWDENGEEKSLAVSEDQEAIQVMTIHKAKGLEFKAVIIPYCNWSFDHRSPNPEILWCRPSEEPFKRLSLLPVQYSKTLEDTIFAEEYAEEKFRVYMDHLNLLYVAFTRARESLVVFTPEGKADKFTDVSALIKRVLKNTDSPSGGTWDDTETTWTKGDFTFSPAESVKMDQILLRDISSHEFSGKLRLIYRGMDFFDPDAGQRVQDGTVMHEIFARIRTSEDIDRALDSVCREGIIDIDRSERLRPEINRLMQMDTVKEWFDGSWKVIAEQDILTKDGSIRRPDRVMLKSDEVIVVDYKFGQKKSSGHLAQVKKYASMLKQMKYEQVKGFIWYVNLNEVVGV